MGFRDMTARMLIKGASYFAPGSLPAAYHGASTAQRLSMWRPGSGSMTALLTGSGEVLRSRSRDMIRNNPWADQAVSRYVSSSIGTGIRPKSLHPDERIARQIDDAWRRWVDESDAQNCTNFYGQQVMALRSMFESADCFARFRARRPGDGLSVPLQVELLESDMVPLSETRQESEGRVVRAGIVFDAISRRIGYKMYRHHPGDLVHSRGYSGETVFVPAENVAHIFRPLRVGQVRGVPQLASVLVRLYELDKYEDAEQQRMSIASMLTGFIKRHLDDRPDSPMDGVVGESETGVEVSNLEAGTFQVLGYGEEVQFSQPPDIGAGIGDFIQHMTGSIAAGGRVTREQLTGDLSKVNYSSIRAGMLDHRRECEQFQHCFFIYQFCRPTWRKFIDTAVLAGTIDAPDFNRNRAYYYDARWVPHGHRWVDPQKEVEALVRAIRAGLISRQEAVRMSGFDPDLIDREINEDRVRREKSGMVLDSDPSQTNRSGSKHGMVGGGSGEPAADDPDQDDDPDAGDRMADRASA